MQIGTDTIKGTMKVSIAKLRALGIKAKTRRVCDCQIKMSLTANMIRLTIPDGNIEVTLQLNDVVKGVEAATNQYNTKKLQDTFRRATGMKEQGRAESE